MKKPLLIVTIHCESNDAVERLIRGLAANMNKAELKLFQKKMLAEIKRVESKGKDNG